MKKIHIFFKFLWHRVGDGKWSFLMTLNGALAGMVGNLTNNPFLIVILTNMIIVVQCSGCNKYKRSS